MPTSTVRMQAPTFFERLSKNNTLRQKHTVQELDTMFLMYPFITGKSADNKATNLEYLAAAHFLGVHSENEEMLAVL